VVVSQRAVDEGMMATWHRRLGGLGDRVNQSASSFLVKLYVRAISRAPTQGSENACRNTCIYILSSCRPSVRDRVKDLP
jgi:hypothetical protein